MTYDEYLVWYDREEGNRGEWVDGEVIVLMPPKVIHQIVLGFLYRLLSDHADRFNLGRVFISPMEMLLREQCASRQPDLMFVAREHLERVTADRIDGPADLAVELISDDSTTRDRRDKRAEYEAASVLEYWLLDPRPGQHCATILQLDATGRYQEIMLDDHGRYHSAVLSGFTLDPTWLWQDPLPNPQHLRTTTLDS
jgi:Uma2 family endonuclease